MSGIVEKNINLDGVVVCQCMECKHYKKDTLSCLAFSKIPMDIIQNKVDHTKPYKGDNGIRFEEIKTEAKKK